MLSKPFVEKKHWEASWSLLNTSCLLNHHVFFRSHQCCVLVFLFLLLLYLQIFFFKLFIKWMYRSKPMRCYFANDNLPDGLLWGITACLTLRTVSGRQYLKRPRTSDSCGCVLNMRSQQATRAIPKSSPLTSVMTAVINSQWQKTHTHTHTSACGVHDGNLRVG